MPIRQVAQRAVDLDRAAGFYRMLLGQEPAARFDPPGLLFFVLGDTRLLLDAGAPSALIYLSVVTSSAGWRSCVQREWRSCRSRT